MKPTIIGLDLAKSVFQVHGVDAEGQVVIRRKLRRREVLSFFEGLEPCLVGLEACAKAHFWTRELKPTFSICVKRTPARGSTPPVLSACSVLTLLALFPAPKKGTGRPRRIFTPTGLRRPGRTGGRP